CFEFPFSFLFSGKKSYYSSVSPVKPEQNDKNLTESLPGFTPLIQEKPHPAGKGSGLKKNLNW
ncbi:MAG: hypothetical protein ACTSV0_02190, partial [Candidatus Freyarchaeota archaeon]